MTRALSRSRYLANSSDLKPRRMGYRKMILYTIVLLIAGGLIFGAMYKQNEEE